MFLIEFTSIYFPLGLCYITQTRLLQFWQPIPKLMMELTCVLQIFIKVFLFVSLFNLSTNNWRNNWQLFRKQNAAMGLTSMRREERTPQRRIRVLSRPG